MSATVSTSNITSGFIDLATYDELEKYLYGGASATAYFVRETRKATWFTLVPVVLSRANGNGDFGTDFSVNISRAGDYLLAAWLRVITPKVEINDSKNTTGNYYRVAWCRNFMHNLIQDCCITFNDLSAARFDNYHLDFWAAFTVSASKYNGYVNMIGDFQAMKTPAVTLESQILNLPLPFFFSRDSGVALPTAALPYNEMRITYSFRNWTDLLTVWNITNATNTTSAVPASATIEYLKTTPSLQLVQTWANYAIVSNDERKRMACAPRNILIEQVQTAPVQPYTPKTDKSYDLRFSHAIKVMFFAARNSTTSSIWSNYSTHSPTVLVSATSISSTTAASIEYKPNGSGDPIYTCSLTYENTNRLASMGSDYYSLVQPWYHAPTIPEESGYHMYSYSLDFMCLDPKGSTNYGKLTNVSISPVATDPAKNQETNGQTYRFITTVINNNIIRISGGKQPNVPPTVGCHPRYDISWMGKQCKISSVVF